MGLSKTIGREFSQRQCLSCSVLICTLLVVTATTARARSSQRPTSLAILDFGNSNFSKLAADKLRTNLRSERELFLFDPELSRAAARGIGYATSLNMTLAEARDLGAAMASDFYIIGDAQTLRRSSSNAPIYYESYCSLLVISSRTGRLVLWDRPSFQGETAQAAETLLLSQLANGETRQRCLIAIRRSQEDERIQREITSDTSEAIIEDSSNENSDSDARALSLPRPYRRLRPEYPDSAARAEVEATVDVLVDVGVDGEVGQVQVVRWAGFGLDEATMATVHQLHFFPAMRDGTAVPMRVLLRYNFRKPPK
jgi:TonB family protein